MVVSKLTLVPLCAVSWEITVLRMHSDRFAKGPKKQNNATMTRVQRIGENNNRKSHYVQDDSE